LFCKSRIESIENTLLQKNEIEVQLASSEIKALRARMNPHFIYNALNSIQYFILNNNPELAQKSLTNFSKLIRNTLNISKEKLISIELEIQTLKLYAEIESLRFENSFDFEIFVDENINQQTTQIPPMLIQPFIENSIWHGLSTKQNKGKITLTITKENRNLLCVIQDNGIGRKQSKQTEKNTNVEHTSIGILNIEERLQLLKKIDNNLYELKIIDLFDENKNSTGTRVELRISNTK